MGSSPAKKGKTGNGKGGDSGGSGGMEMMMPMMMKMMMMMMEKMSGSSGGGKSQASASAYVSPEKQGLIMQVKNFQKSSPENKQMWYSFCGTQGTGKYDPSTYAPNVLKQFLASVGM